MLYLGICCTLVVTLALDNVKLVWALVFNFTLNVFWKRSSGIVKLFLMLVFILDISCKTTGVCLEEESLSSDSSMSVMELQSGCRSPKPACLQRATKQCGWGGGKGFTTLCCLHSFRIGTLWSQSSRAMWMKCGNQGYVTFRKLPSFSSDL